MLCKGVDPSAAAPRAAKPPSEPPRRNISPGASASDRTVSSVPEDPKDASYCRCTLDPSRSTVAQTPSTFCKATSDLATRSSPTVGIFSSTYSISSWASCHSI